MERSRRFDVLIVGGGPAGIAAACSAARTARRVGVVDANPALGGQIWRADVNRPPGRLAKTWLHRVRQSDVEMLCGTSIVARARPNVLLAETATDARELEYKKLILATGARERFLPFPGWTLPNVTGAGGLQSLVKGGLPIEGRKVAVAGSGPMLVAAAAYLRHRGADVRLIAEQAPWSRLARFGRTLLGKPGKLLEAARYARQILGVRYAAGCWPVATEGDRKLTAVTFQAGERTWIEPCDYLACGFGLVANVELPMLLGCRVEQGCVVVDRWQETSEPGIYSAGETTGIGGLDTALVEGRIAGQAAVGNQAEAARLSDARNRAKRFAEAMDQTFSLCDDLKELATPDTLVCRCEDVTRGQLDPHTTWQAAKLQTRCGMGACQGRVCGGATEFLHGWNFESVRPPIFPARLETLASTSVQDSEQ